MQPVQTTPPASAAKPPPPPPLGGPRSDAVDTLARTLWGEARGESDAGIEAVACVVVNRARLGVTHRRLSWWGVTIIDVCRKPKQFSCWNDDDPNCAKLKKVTTADKDFLRCLDVAARAVDGKLFDATSGATHYHTKSVRPAWAEGHAPTVTIGCHRFYNDIEG